jgi:hypothetical protein
MRILFVRPKDSVVDGTTQLANNCDISQHIAQADLCEFEVPSRGGRDQDPVGRIAIFGQVAREGMLGDAKAGQHIEKREELDIFAAIA